MDYLDIWRVWEWPSTTDDWSYSNIWNPSQQKRAVEHIKDYYSMSDRLEQTLTLEYPDKSASDAAKERHQVPVAEKELTSSDPEVEAASNSSIELESRQPGPPSESAPEHSLMRLMKNTLNYTSIDQGPNCALRYTAWPVIIWTDFKCSHLHRSELASQATRSGRREEDVKFENAETLVLVCSMP